MKDSDINNFNSKFISQNKVGRSRNLSYINALMTGEILSRYEFACKFCDIKDECKIYLSDKGSDKSYNFYGGILPLSVAKKIKKEIFNSPETLDYVSYSLKNYKENLDDAKYLIDDILSLKGNYEIIFLQSSASSQFYMVPLNFINPKEIGDYIVTDNWSQKAIESAKKIGSINIAGSSTNGNHTFIPENWDLSTNPAYVHITSNNTIFGTQWKKFPDFGNIPIIADMTSDIFSRPIDISKFGMIYAGSQKNLGVPGVTLIIIRKDLINKSKNSSCPNYLKYSNFIVGDTESYERPPSMAIYIIKLILEWIREEGGLKKIDKINKDKSKIIYDVIDNSDGFYIGHAKKEFRSSMNITFSIKDKHLTKKFISDAAKEGLNGLKGLQSEDGLRASIFNAMPKKACQKLAGFMKEFKNINY
jgi:phosphoserine aminotransferase